ncbi:hypothetical protein EB796_008967 [Bugula neritina]|uniref:Uncharacterized protein n=1 Tax=Bugula neritina TaxID=10212 RepID=A0A7J7K258_BUGNE|nr:hypothetical protein EB796_008967 [Bugula neritina]
MYLPFLLVEIKFIKRVSYTCIYLDTDCVGVCVWEDFAQTPASMSCHAHSAGRVKVAGASIRVLTTQPVLVMDRSVTMVSVKRVVRYKCKNQNVCPISLREDMQSVK